MTKGLRPTEETVPSDAAHVAAAGAPDLGDRYSMGREIGRGGMGRVFSAHDRRLDRAVAVKVLPSGAPGEVELRRFELEARAAGSLNHPNILAVHDIGSWQGRPYIVSELLEGRTLRSRLEGKPLPLRRAMDYAMQLAQGLSAAHAKGIVHRDLKPENLFITNEGRLKILDFGIAKLTPRAGDATQPPGPRTETGALIGTVAYMSPEQARGEAADERSDLFSAGIILHEMLSGRPPFEGGSTVETAYAILNHEPPDLPLDVPALVDRIVRRCLEKDRAHRFQSASDLALALAAASSSEPEPGPARRRGTKWAAALAAATLLLLGASFQVWRLATGARGPADPSGGQPAALDRRRLAVLPLANISPRSEDEYFAAGMTEQLTSTLAQIPGLRVIARTAAARYQGAHPDLREIGRELMVGTVLEGSVRKDAARLRIAVQLIDVKSQEHLWSQEYDRAVADVFAIQSDVARQVAEALKVHLAGAAAGKDRPPASLPAYDAYLRGLYLLGARDARPEPERAPTQEAAIGMFERATELDPAFALGYAALAQAYAFKFFYFDADKRWEQSAFVAVEKALALDGQLAEAHIAKGKLAWTLSNHFPHELAAREARAALTLKPNLPEAHDLLGHVYLHTGLLEKALAELDSSLQLDPVNRFAPPRIARIHGYQGKYELALTELERVEGWEYERALLLARLGRLDQAMALLERASGTPKLSAAARADLSSTRAVVLAGLGRRQEALESIAKTIPLGAGSSHFHHAEYAVGAAYAVLKDSGRAVEWLEKAAQDGLPCYPLFANDPVLNDLRQDPGFMTLLEKLRARWERWRTTL